MVKISSKLPFAVTIKIGPKEEDCIVLSPYSTVGPVDENLIEGTLPKGVYLIPATA